MTDKFDFKGGTSPDIKTAYRERKRYKETAFLNGVDFIDTWYQYPNYGLLNADYEPVVLNSDEYYSNMTTLSSPPEPEVRAASFVASAFRNFRDYYVAKTTSARLDFPVFIGEAIPTVAHISFEDSYLEYLDALVSQYADFVLDEMTSVDMFTKLLSYFVEINIKKFPITRSGFLLSTKCPIAVSGLVVELADLEYSKDDRKSDILNSIEFQCFAELATQSGFFIDKNAPWRLIANLESPMMKSYIERYKPDASAETILNKTFRQKTHYEDISSVYYFYSNVYREILTRIGVSGPSGPPPEVRGTQGQEFLISETLRIRMLETDIPHSEYSRLNNEVLSLHRTYASRFPENPLKQASGKIGKICSEKLKEIYLAKSQINSYDKTTLKDYR